MSQIKQVLLSFVFNDRLPWARAAAHQPPPRGKWSTQATSAISPSRTTAEAASDTKNRRSGRGRVTARPTGVPAPLQLSSTPHRATRLPTRSPHTGRHQPLGVQQLARCSGSAAAVSDTGTGSVIGHTVEKKCYGLGRALAAASRQGFVELVHRAAHLTTLRRICRKMSCSWNNLGTGGVVDTDGLLDMPRVPPLTSPRATTCREAHWQGPSPRTA